MPDMDMDTFHKLLKGEATKASTARKKRGRINWDQVLKKLQKSKRIWKTTEIWEQVVKKRVNRVRTKAWLHKQFEDEHTALRVLDSGYYLWFFEPAKVKEWFASPNGKEFIEKMEREKAEKK